MVYGNIWQSYRKLILTSGCDQFNHASVWPLVSPYLISFLISNHYWPLHKQGFLLSTHEPAGEIHVYIDIISLSKLQRSLNKMSHILQMTFSNLFSCVTIVVFWFILIELCYSIKNKPELVQNSCQTGSKPLGVSEPMMALNRHIYHRLKISVSRWNSVISSIIFLNISGVKFYFPSNSIMSLIWDFHPWIMLVTGPRWVDSACPTRPR